MSPRIVFIGAGNLATCLAVRLKEQGCEMEQVYSRTESSAVTLARKLQSGYTTSATDIIPDADIYFVALKDSVVDEVLSKVRFNNRLVVHCSGSLPLSVLGKYSSNTGVFYPLQTFSKSREVDFKKIPIFLEASSEENIDILLKLAQNISENVTLLDSEKRLFLHIAAVFACNFVNHMYTIASDLLDSKDISYKMLQPLIHETAMKVMQTAPQNAQTGPAMRFDKNIISAHENALTSFPAYKMLYHTISENIFNYHNLLQG